MWTLNFSSNNWKSVMLENHSIQKACEGITEEELKKLVWATDKLQQEINKNDRIAASRTNIEFHRLLYSNSRNNFLQKTTDSSWFLFESFLSARNEELHWWINLGMRNETTSTYS
ncbi:FCD domain-containing protein [Peribacillus frigoritolerans]|jgi:DNA-binding GntR family transcriptional regulator|uniref:FCD domain-containing protein n=2 Tax=Peribacillus frigoritolerans TaxID=450367 RepID=UPI003990D705